MFDAKPEDRSALAVVCFGFRTEHEPQADGSLKSVDYASWGKRGYANWESSETVARLMKSHKDNHARPDSQPTVWDELAPHYERWKAGQDAVVTEGYDLNGWASITKGQIAACKALHIHSVQDLAKIADDSIQRLGPGFVKLREQARSFAKTLEDGSTKVAAENAKLKERLDAMEKERDEDRKAMAAFMAKHNMQPAEMPGDIAAEPVTEKPQRQNRKAA